MLAFHLPIKQHCSSIGNNNDVLNNYPLLPRLLGADILQPSPPLPWPKEENGRGDAC